MSEETQKPAPHAQPARHLIAARDRWSRTALVGLLFVRDSRPVRANSAPTAVDGSAYEASGRTS